MILRSLRLRMLGLALVWVVISLIVAAGVLQHLFTVNIERAAQVGMSAAVSRLAAVLMPENPVPAISAPLPDPLYSTPFSGRYWQIEAMDNGEITRSRSLWDFVLQTPSPEAQGELLHHEVGPGEQHLLALTRRIELEGANGPRSFLVTIGEDHRAIDEAIASFQQDTTRLLLLLGGLLLVAAWLQVLLGLAPIKTLRRAIESVRRGDAERLAGNHPTELSPLVEEVNQLLTARDAAMEKARSRAADLAHGLKTPLAALHGVADRLRESGSPHDAEMIESLSTEMSERIDHQLRLASLRLRTTSHAARSSLNAAVLRTLTVLKKTGRGEGLHWVAQLGDDCTVDLHRQDLLELVGILLENAAKWANSRVLVYGSQEGEAAVLNIEDDGPGIAESDLAQLGVRGRRLDESKPGTGLGLAMAAEILEINGGTISYHRAEVGGLRVRLSLPLANAAGSAA
jgi:signal transduction histidine kinase